MILLTGHILEREVPMPSKDSKGLRQQVIPRKVGTGPRVYPKPIPTIKPPGGILPESAYTNDVDNERRRGDRDGVESESSAS